MSEEVGAGTVDSSELDDDDTDAEEDTVCDVILDGTVNFCCANASTKQLLRRSLLCINIVVIAMQNRQDETNDDSEECDLEEENIILEIRYI